ncbi:MAG: DUF4270 family protein [Chitinophagales bacterium]
MLKNRQLVLTLGSIITTTLIVLSSCRKINESTELGGDIIPAVDNVNTFDTLLTVEAYNDLFTLGGPVTDTLKEDSTRSDYRYEQFLGWINDDPLFGKTDAQMYFELKPQAFPFKFNNIPYPDSVILDSVVLILDYVETYGDSSVAQTVTVSELISEFRVDTSYLIRKNSDFFVGGLLGSRTFKPSALKDSVKALFDTTSHQLRIKLSDAFGNRLLFYDTNSANNMYASDSLFKTKFKGFALKSTSGNAVMGFDLQGENTKLGIYYRHLHGTGDYDSTVNYFIFKPSLTYGLAGSASHNYAKRDYGTSPIAMAQGGTTPDGYVYMQNTPGSFAKLKIPGLTGLSNRVVHRAELIAEQAYDPSDTLFPPPAFLYLDAYSPVLGRYRNIPYDVVFDGTNGVFNLGSFGAAPINGVDVTGKAIKEWHFNLTRYVQHIVTGTETNYELRLVAPLYAIDQYVAPEPGAPPISFPPTVFINPTIIKGRVRLVGNTSTLDPNPHRLRLRIVYSKL